jgi:hypothetical protein
MKPILKRALMWLYMREFISPVTVARLFHRFDLKGH